MILKNIKIKKCARSRLKRGHSFLFGCLAQSNLAAMSWCLGTTRESGWQPNCHQLLIRAGVWRQARPPNRQLSQKSTYT